MSMPAGAVNEPFAQPPEVATFWLVSSNDVPLRPPEPLMLVDRFAPLHRELIALLRGLAPSDWDRPTACALWSVGDIAAHLLDDLRRLSAPVLDLFVRAMPPAFGEVDREEGTSRHRHHGGRHRLAALLQRARTQRRADENPA